MAISVACFCLGCALLGSQVYTCNANNVKLVQIVQLDEYIEDEYRFEYTILCEVSDTQEFISRLNKIEQQANWGDPRRMNTGNVVIRIEYLTGEYDLLHQDAQNKHYSGRNHDGFTFFDDEQFEQLISDYLP